MLELIDIYKSYQGHPLLKGISFGVAQDETLCLLGASGSGKSTLLHIIAGITEPESGQVLWSGKDLWNVPAYQRQFGLVFQDYALFPHLNVAANVAFGLKMRSVGVRQIAQRVEEALQMVGLADFASRQVTDLSGGEQQRIALARALVLRPRLLMLDEPLGALDRSLRDRLMGELREVIKSSRIPVIYVTHDQEEAFSVADRVILIHQGEIVQQGAPETVYNHPAPEWVARFLGLGNILEAKLLDRGHAETSMGIVELGTPQKFTQVRSVTVLIRPDCVTAGPTGTFKGRVVDVVFRREGFQVTLEGGFYYYSTTPPPVGEEIAFNTQAELLT
ncbi:MAG: ABC transporter ATP-binding protein [Anaerolineales bacterium]|nr:MAG: ABC transporter ATP-binding protein [Anaerolineales bacterium]